MTDSLGTTFYEAINIDGLVKSLGMLFSVIPAKAGIQSSHIVISSLDSGFHRSDNFLRSHQHCKFGKTCLFPWKMLCGIVALRVAEKKALLKMDFQS